MAFTFLKNSPIRLFVGQSNAATEFTMQKLVFVGEENGKNLAVKQLLNGDFKSLIDEDKSFIGLKPPILVFVDSIQTARNLLLELVPLRIPMAIIHGEKSHSERSKIIEEFRIGNIWILITTELLSRGIDFKGVNSVLNYDFPDSSASYIHRIGRTGRAGRKGIAVTLFSVEDSDKLRSIANVMQASGCKVPAFMLELKKTKRKELIQKKRLLDKKNKRQKKNALRQSQRSSQNNDIEEMDNSDEDTDSG
ncbi:hypothetical protein DI09_9p300 [Mitosporidium daphniae]|uniref:RNA helicase n=1 Tax=Mitosporidium daphniae TaxID=1485682 RepID=A0A098VLH9_9MICR|nr:uncharacterized protein DI09_9p300 [Mitosporidium daphniae]KGG49947.1 hypothetical protein DI09_9p300 [Mitosporidium daphniae]|eukprot:XP_013236374.1 uncharacterized protein DI09_9p300 [Mitosporidium daphniae]